MASAGSLSGMRVAAWRATEDGVSAPLVRDDTFLEKNLETWIDKQPSLLLDGVTWIARQMCLPDGSRLDLLGFTQDDA